MRWIVVALALVGCGADEAPARDCSAAATSCEGADLVVAFDAGPGVLGRVCQWWATGAAVTMTDEGTGWCLVPPSRPGR